MNGLNMTGDPWADVAIVALSLAFVAFFFWLILKD